jgi:hypothetical protein
MGQENIFILTIENESLHQVSNDNGVKIIKTLPHQKIWLLRHDVSATKTFLSTPVPLLLERLTTRLITY